MKVLLTGHKGYIGAVAGPILRAAGHEITGLDTDLFAGCDFGEGLPGIPEVRSRTIHWGISTYSSPTTLTISRQ
jgi:nucleoside-diphosphate-sugar epimerase